MKLIFMAFSLSILLSACGGGGGASTPPVAQDPAVWSQGTWDNVRWQ